MVRAAALCSLAIAVAWAQQHVQLSADSAAATQLTVYANAAIIKQRFTTQLRRGETLLTITKLPEQVGQTSILLQSSDPTFEVVSYRLLSSQSPVASSAELLRQCVGRQLRWRRGAEALSVKLLVAPSKVAASSSGVPCYEGAIIELPTGEALADPCGELLVPPPLPAIDTSSRGSARLQQVEALLRSRDGSKSPTKPSDVALDLTYQCDGFRWSATYNAFLLDDATLELEGHCHVTNPTWLGFRNVPVRLVAGDVRISRQSKLPIRTMKASAEEPNAFMAASRAPEVESFDEYYLYSLPPVVILPNCTTSLLLRPRATFRYTRQLIAYGGEERYSSRRGGRTEVAVSTILKFANTAADSQPLPAGNVRVWRYRDGDKSQRDYELIGEDNIRHTPVRDTVTVTLGTSFDVRAWRRVVSTKRLSDRTGEYTAEYTVANYSAKAADVRVIEPIEGDWEITSSTLPYTKRSASEAEFAVSVPAKGETRFQFTVRRTW